MLLQDGRTKMLFLMNVRKVIFYLHVSASYTIISYSYLYYYFVCSFFQLLMKFLPKIRKFFP